MEKIQSIVVWFGGFFEDQKGSASSKRATLYILLYFLSLIVKAAIAGVVIDLNLLIVIGGMILFLVGAVTSEFFNKIKPE